MRSAFAAAWVAALSLTGGPATAADPSEALAVVRKFNVAANGVDREAYASYCAADMVIVDHMPPYQFRGPTACQDEWDAVGAWMEKDRIVVSKYSKMAAPSFVDATADRVYAVYPVTASLRRGGKREIERGVWTFVVRREAQGWRIASVTWSTLQFAPAAAGQKARPGH